MLPYKSSYDAFAIWGTSYGGSYTISINLASLTATIDQNLVSRNAYSCRAYEAEMRKSGSKPKAKHAYQKAGQEWTKLKESEAGRRTLLKRPAAALPAARAELPTAVDTLEGTTPAGATLTGDEKRDQAQAPAVDEPPKAAVAEPSLTSVPKSHSSESFGSFVRDINSLATQCNSASIASLPSLTSVSEAEAPDADSFDYTHIDTHRDTQIDSPSHNDSQDTVPGTPQNLGGPSASSYPETVRYNEDLTQANREALFYDQNDVPAEQESFADFVSRVPAPSSWGN